MWSPLASAPPLTYSTLPGSPPVASPFVVEETPVACEPAPVQLLQVAPAQEFEDLVQADPRFAKDLQLQRRQQLGMELPGVQSFLSKTSVASLGSYCAVATMFEQLGLRQAAGPFDFIRSECQGVSHLLRNGLEDFLDWEGPVRDVSGLKVFSTSWGGSFWHHDISDPKVRETFQRRRERFLNMRNENLLFVRVVNGTHELAQIPELYSALKLRFGASSRVLLLVLIDLQDYEREVRTQDLGSDVIFSCVHSSTWEAPILVPSPEEQAKKRLHMASDAYAKAVSRALFIWCGYVSVNPVAAFPTWAHFAQQLVPWQGTNPKLDSYQPTRLQPPMQLGQLTAATAAGPPVAKQVILQTVMPTTLPLVTAAASMLPGPTLRPLPSSRVYQFVR
eukprot:Skav214272  [mRNA]  locus=scaffold642:254388:270442:+ [translate_table: standard]